MRNKKAPSPKVRVTLDLTPEAYNKTLALETAAGCSSRAELYRRALALFDLMVTKKAEGFSFEAVRGDERAEVWLA